MSNIYTQNISEFININYEIYTKYPLPNSNFILNQFC